jgi:hypothetical protein
MGAMRSVLFQNNWTVNNCRRMSAAFPGAPDRYNRYLSLFCRAGGDGIGLLVTDGGNYVLENNTFAGYGATSYDIECSGSCKTAKITYRNNLNIGYKDPATGKLPGIFYMSEVPGNVLSRDHNIYYNMRACPSGWTEHCMDPKIVYMPEWKGEASLDAINLHLTSRSPARGAGVAAPKMTKDYDGVARPDNSAEDIGAFQYHP